MSYWWNPYQACMWYLWVEVATLSAMISKFNNIITTHNNIVSLPLSIHLFYMCYIFTNNIHHVHVLLQCMVSKITARGNLYKHTMSYYYYGCIYGNHPDCHHPPIVLWWVNQYTVYIMVYHIQMNMLLCKQYVDVLY